MKDESVRLKDEAVRLKDEFLSLERKHKSTLVDLKENEGQCDKYMKINEEEALLIDFYETEARSAKILYLSTQKRCVAVLREFNSLKRAIKHAHKQKLEAFNRWGWTRIVCRPQSEPELSATFDQRLCEVLKENWANDIQCIHVLPGAMYRLAMYRAILKASGVS